MGLRTCVRSLVVVMMAIELKYLTSHRNITLIHLIILYMILSYEIIRKYVL